MIYLLHQLIERAAERDAGHDAFRAPGQALTYGQLLNRANQLAHGLTEAGVRRGDRVGILMPRTVETAVAVYGILKAGAAYVPIDPQIPVGGLHRLIEDCGIHALVSHSSQQRTLHALAEEKSRLRSVFGVETELSGLECFSTDKLESFPAASGPDLRATENDLAYIMYSSGSTGRPKGIQHTHHSGLAYAGLSVATYDVKPQDRVGNHSPLHFDMSTFGYFSAPYAGATTLIVPEAYTKLAASLSQLMEAERLTIWYSVPLALIQLLTRGVLESRNLESLRWVLFGGEPFARKHLRALMRYWPQARFSNVYGPAEVNQCTFFHLGAADELGTTAGEGRVDEDDPIPIGRIWPNTEGLVLEGDQEVAPGETGELAIHSATMMRGYWRRPDLDARAFHQPESEGLGKTFYRTGDLVRELPDGNLLFLGRKDRQLKIRGYRVELDEVERTLASHDAVEEAAVVPLRGDEGVEQLWAAVSLKPGMEARSEDVLEHVASCTSWYARPAQLEILDSFPRTTSGKIDRRKLQDAAEAKRSIP